jgi:protein phosphatase
MRYFKISEIGPRKENQDRFSIAEQSERLLCCVADGVGGVEFGGLASDFIVEQFKLLDGIPTFRELETWIKSCHEQLVRKSVFEWNGRAATTFTCGIISNNHIYGVHVGDSRVAIVRERDIEVVTDEHTEAGRRKKEDATLFEYLRFPRNSPIEAVVGIDGMLNIQRFYSQVRSKDRIVLSTDGFHDIFPLSELLSLSKRNLNFDMFASKLKTEIDNRILRDNLTVIVVEV